MSIRILLIDDNPVDRELAIRALRGLAVPPGPVDLVTASEWSEAIPHVDAGGFDLVLLDYNLPALTGLDVLRLLRERGDLPVIMLTGQDDVATAVETLRAGAYEYVPKSVTWGPSLCLAIERVLARVRLERELAESRAQLAAHAAGLEHTVASRTAVVRAQAAEIEALYLKAEEGARVKSEFVSNVSHELRTPLNIILGYVDLLEEQMTQEGADEAGEMLGKVRGHTQRLHQLVESLLALNRLNAGSEGVNVSRFPLATLMDELHEQAVMLKGDRELTLEWAVTAEPSEVEADRDKVRAIAYHLLSNAIKFTPHGRVDLAMSRRPDGGIVMTVRDTGIGLPPEAQALVFDEFRQLDGSSTRRYDGLGLGLGIVRRYAALLQGTIRMESAPGSGTTVVVDLPPRPQPALDALDAASPS